MAPNNLFVAVVFFNWFPVENLMVCGLQGFERWRREIGSFMPYGVYTCENSAPSLSLPSADVAFMWEVRNDVAILCIQA